MLVNLGGVYFGLKKPCFFPPWVWLQSPILSTAMPLGDVRLQCLKSGSYGSPGPRPDSSHQQDDDMSSTMANLNSLNLGTLVYWNPGNFFPEFCIPGSRYFYFMKSGFFMVQCFGKYTNLMDESDY